MALIAKAFIIWLAILVLAIANGALREVVLVPKLGKKAGLVLSGSLLAALVLLVAFFSMPWVGVSRLTIAVTVGVGWLVLTLAFEFSFGRLQGKSWDSLLEAYVFKNGNIWPLVLLVIAVAPLLAAWLRGLLP